MGAKTQSSQRRGKERVNYLQQARKTPWIFPDNKIREVLRYMCIHVGFGKGEFSKELGQNHPNWTESRFYLTEVMGWGGGQHHQFAVPGSPVFECSKGLKSCKK